MKIGHALLDRVEHLDRMPDEIEQRRVGLGLLDQTIDDLGHKHRDGRFSHIERHRLQRKGQHRLAKAVHLGTGRLQTLDRQRKHRLQQRHLVAATLARTDAPDHIGLPSERVREQIGHDRFLAVAHRMEHNAARLVALH